MTKFALPFAFVLCAVGQQPAASETAPPEVDAALRARVTQFYQAHVDAKYRLADQVVAEDSKDLFFAAAKPRYKGFEIVRINYSENFTQAEAVVATKGDWVIHGQTMPVTMPLTSKWKIVDGAWFWYLVPLKEYKTPFGSMDYNAASKNGAAAPAPMGGLPGDPKELALRILSQVKVEPTNVQLSSYEPSTVDVAVRNDMQGSIRVSADIDGAFPGLSYKWDKKEIPAGSTGILTLICKPKDRAAKPSLTVRVSIDPTNQVVPIRVTFAIPPEIEKLIPPAARTNPLQQ